MDNKFQTIEIGSTIRVKESILNIENYNKQVILSWENIEAFTPSSHDGFIGKLSKKFCSFRKEVPSKQIIKNGIF
jgi:hypothetical protein